MKKVLYPSLLILVSFSLLILSCKKKADETTSPPAALTVDLGADRTIFEGDSLLLDAGNAGSTYLWSTGAATQKIVVDTTGKYWGKVTNGSRTASDTVLTFVSYKLPNIETRFGRMLIWLYPQTPLHRHNFIKLVAEKFYDSLLFHRVIHGFVIQGGDPLGTGYGGTGYTIPAEFRAALTHVNGAVGAARDNNPAKASNGSQFYIVNNPAGTHSLDGNYTVFGQVISGISVVDSISLVPTNPANNRPLTNVYMDNIRFVYFTASELKNNFGFSITK